MRKFIKNILIFFAPILLLSYPLDYFISHQYQKSNEYPGEIEVWNDIYNHNIKADVAIYGTSRAWVHFNTKMIEDSLHISSYNFGMDGHNFWCQYLRHLEYLKNNKAPKTIIVSLDFFALQKRKDLNQPNQFLPFMLWNKNMISYTKDFEGYNKSDYYIPLIRYAGKNGPIISVLKSLFSHNKNNATFRYHGYKGMDKIWNGDFEKAKKKSSNFKSTVDSQTLVLFEKFITECKNNNINVILVYSPVYFEGQALMGKGLLLDTFEQIAIRNQIPYLDYTKDSICYDKKYFYNAIHLNQIGSNLFTAKFIHDLQSKKLLFKQ